MFWDKKEDDEEGLPDLPPLKPSVKTKDSDIPEFPEPEEKLEGKHSLPSFPDSPTEPGFSQSTIKDAVETGEIKEKEPDLPELPDFPNEDSKEPVPEQIEMKEWTPPQPPLHSPKKLPTISPPHIVPNPPPAMPRRALSAPHQKNSDVFVKIDKFHSAKKALVTAKEKLSEVDALLKRIRETKMREEQELATWEKELAAVKSKVQDVTENIFEKA